MLKTRIIPCLLLKDSGLVKTIRFGNPTYIGDPINAVRIFNTKQVDELIFLDIMAGPNRAVLNIGLITKISDECRMPFTVGGGIRNLKDIRALLNAGAEKVVMNTAAFEDPGFVKAAAAEFGSQAIVVSLDVKAMPQGQYDTRTNSGQKSAGMTPVQAAQLMQEMGAGEIVLNSIDRDGTMQGYDIALIRQVADAIDVPLIALGGAGKPADLAAAAHEGHASAVAAGSLFVFHGSRRAVLINFPTPEEIERLFTVGNS